MWMYNLFIQSPLSEHAGVVSRFALPGTNCCEHDLDVLLWTHERDLLLHTPKSGADWTFKNISGMGYGGAHF